MTFTQKVGVTNGLIAKVSQEGTAGTDPLLVQAIATAAQAAAVLTLAQAVEDIATAIKGGGRGRERVGQT